MADVAAAPWIMNTAVQYGKPLNRHCDDLRSVLSLSYGGISKNLLCDDADARSSKLQAVGVFVIEANMARHNRGCLFL